LKPPAAMLPATVKMCLTAKRRLTGGASHEQSQLLSP
jgi:hypothetical protein